MTVIASPLAAVRDALAALPAAVDRVAIDVVYDRAAPGSAQSDAVGHADGFILTGTVDGVGVAKLAPGTDIDDHPELDGIYEDFDAMYQGWILDAEAPEMFQPLTTAVAAASQQILIVAADAAVRAVGVHALPRYVHHLEIVDGAVRHTGIST